MKRIKIVGLALVAVFAFSAIAAGSAFAHETSSKFMQCKTAVKTGTPAKYTGTYTEKECKTAATPTQISEGKENKYELKAITPSPTEPEQVAEAIPFTGKSKSVVITTQGESGNWQVIVCGKSTISGKVYDNYGSGKVSPEAITFEKCEGQSNGKEAVCKNEEPEAKKPLIKYEAGYGETLWDEPGEEKPVLATVGSAPSFECGGKPGEPPAEIVEMHGVLVGALENTSKGIDVSWTVGGEHHVQTPASYYSEESLVENFYYTRWYTGPEEGNEEGETTIAGITALKTEAKGISIRNASEES